MWIAGVSRIDQTHGEIESFPTVGFLTTSHKSGILGVLGLSLFAPNSVESSVLF